MDISCQLHRLQEICKSHQELQGGTTSAIASAGHASQFGRIQLGSEVNHVLIGLGSCATYALSCAGAHRLVSIGHVMPMALHAMAQHSHLKACQIRHNIVWQPVWVNHIPTCRLSKVSQAAGSCSPCNRLGQTDPCSYVVQQHELLSPCSNSLGPF